MEATQIIRATEQEIDRNLTRRAKEVNRRISRIRSKGKVQAETLGVVV